MSDESDLVEELRALGRVAGSEASSFAVAHAGVRLAVVYSGGSSSTLTLEAFYDTFAKPGVPQPRVSVRAYRDASPGVLPATRPLKILLRPEDSGDVQAKREGVSVEFQTGDTEFDPRV